MSTRLKDTTQLKWQGRKPVPVKSVFGHADNNIFFNQETTEKRIEAVLKLQNVAYGRFHTDHASLQGHDYFCKVSTGAKW